MTNSLLGKGLANGGGAGPGVTFALDNVVQVRAGTDAVVAGDTVLGNAGGGGLDGGNKGGEEAEFVFERDCERGAVWPPGITEGVVWVTGLGRFTGGAEGGEETGLTTEGGCTACRGGSVDGDCAFDCVGGTEICAACSAVLVASTLPSRAAARDLCAVTLSRPSAK
jgi:hypothetical protein